MRRRSLIVLIVTFGLLAGTAQAKAWWMPSWTHPQHHAPRKQHKFVSHYCQTTASPYVGGPTATVCCRWVPYWKDIPDGDGTWTCTIATDPITPTTAGTGSSVAPLLRR